MLLNNIITTFDNGSLGSRNDEERSEMRYVVWIAEFRESSNLWTHIALNLGWVCLSENLLISSPFLGGIWALSLHGEWL